MDNLSPPDPCDPFPSVFLNAYRSIALIHLKDSTVTGTLFTWEGKIWICLSTSALSIAGDSVKITLPASAAGGVGLTLDSVSVRDAIVDLDVPGHALIDVSAYSQQLASAGVVVPSLANPATVLDDSFRGTLCAVVWRETQDPAAPMRISVVRIEAIASAASLANAIILDPDVNAAAAGAGLFNDAGLLVGICNQQTDGAVESAVSAADLAKIASHGQRIGDLDALTQALLGWQNPEGLRALCEFLRTKGFNRSVSWRIERLANGRHDSQCQPTTSSSNNAVVIAVLSESPQDDLSLRLSSNQSSSSGPSAGLGSDDGPEKDAAVRINNPASVGLLDIEVKESTAASTARLLIIEAGEGDSQTEPLPDKLLPGPKGSGTGTPAGSPSGISSSANAAPPANPNGPAIVLQLHGVVGPDASGLPFFTSVDFEEALAEAFAAQPSVIILDIKSGGGRVDTKEEIQRRILTASKRGQRIVAVVRDAGSAAAMIALACPEIVAFPGARLGSAVKILSDGTNTVSLRKLLEDDPELAAKYASFSDALDAEAARATNRSTAIPRAMSDSSAELWWSPTKGFTDSNAGADSTCLDDAKSVLTLTSTQIEQTKLGKAIAGDDELWQSLNMSPPPQVKDLSDRMTRRYSRVLELAEQFGDGMQPGSAAAQAELLEIFNQP